MKFFPEATSTHIDGCLKAAVADNFSKMYSKVSRGFQEPVKLDTMAFGKFFRTAAAAFKKSSSN
jgi:hypothetical protein